MNCATITITDITKPAQSLYTLLSVGSQPGYTVSPAGGIFPAISIIGSVSYLSVQASPTNSTQTVYKGDENTKTDGSLQGKEMAAGSTDVIQAYPHQVDLNTTFLRASANGAKINVEVHYS